MKKSIVFLAAFFVAVLATFAATVASQLIRVEDSCGRCVINDDERKCGKCGGFMKIEEGVVKPEYWILYTYKCKDCGHTAIFKDRWTR